LLPIPIRETCLTDSDGMKSIVSMRRAFSQEVWHQGPVRKQTRPIRHCEQSEAIQTWAAHLRLSLDCFAVARNDDLPAAVAKI
jgi:hypothetical protein